MRVITLDQNKNVIGVKDVGESYTLEINDLVSNVGEIGQIQQPDGSFITPEPIPVDPIPYEPTNAEVAQMISDLQADLIIAGVV
jgi:hypothetical protein